MIIISCITIPIENYSVGHQFISLDLKGQKQKGWFWSVFGPVTERCDKKKNNVDINAISLLNISAVVISYMEQNLI